MTGARTPVMIDEKTEPDTDDADDDTVPAAPGDSDTDLGDTDQHSDADA